MRFDIVTIFPAMVEQALTAGIVGRAIDRGTPVMDQRNSEMARSFAGLAQELTRNDADVKRAAMAEGADAVMDKPVDITRLLEIALDVRTTGDCKASTALVPAP